MRGRLLAALLVASCAGEAGDTGVAGTPPDISGRYQVFVSYVSGCDSDPSWVQDWAEGPLLIEGSADDLSFDFYDDKVFSGTAAVDHTYVFRGETTWQGAVLTLYHSGEVTEDGDATVLDGTFEIEVDDDEFTSNNCNIESGARATEIVGEDD